MSLLVPHREERRIKVNGVELAYDEFGVPDGEPIILIMGFSMQMIAWHEDFCSRLAENGFRVVRFDNRDIGHSTWLVEHGIPDLGRIMQEMMEGKKPTAPYLLSDMADDVVGLMDRLGIESAHVMGMSMGGMIAQTMALEHSERLRSLISLSSSPGTQDPSLPPPTPEAAAVLMTPLPQDREGFITASVKAWKVIGGPYMPMPEDMLEDRARRFYERGLHLPGLARQMAAILASGSRREALKKVKLPTLVLHGDADPLIPPEHAVATAEAIEGARLILIPRMGHEVPPAAWDLIIGAVCQFINEDVSK
ncbi:MAG: alpha/beta fold hydrolase [Syntrophales bacterium]|nr:alpha/beta fold hydrolase [Syntrophales bacterium]